VLGPSTFRDGIGVLADFGFAYAVNVAGLYRGNKTWAIGVVNAVDQRSNSRFRYYSSGSPFEYETVRFLYVHEELIEDEALHVKAARKARILGEAAGK
jgi:phospholipid-binding lipoprotein MlaA